VNFFLHYKIKEIFRSAGFACTSNTSLKNRVFLKKNPVSGNGNAEPQFGVYDVEITDYH